MWIKSPELNGPNGIILDYGKNHLVVASMGNGTPEAGSTIEAYLKLRETITNIGKKINRFQSGYWVDYHEWGWKIILLSDWNAKTYSL